MTVFKYLKNLGTICPSQWDGETSDGKEVYIRYRWGNLTVTVAMAITVREKIGQDGDGFLTDSQLKIFLTQKDIEVLDWRQDF